MKPPGSGLNILFQQLQRIHHAVLVAAFVAMGGVHARADQTVADVIAGFQRDFNIGTVVRVDIDRVIGPRGFGCGNEGLRCLIGIRAAGVLGADRYLAFGALQAFADAAHVDGDGIRDADGNSGGAAVPDFFINGDVAPGMALERRLLVVNVLREPEQDADAQLVIQEAALDVAVAGDSGARLKADEIADGDAEFANVFGGLDVFIENDFGRVEGSFDFLVIAVDVNGSVDQLESAFVDAGEFCRDAAVLRLGVVRVQAADVLNAETAVRLDRKSVV